MKQATEDISSVISRVECGDHLVFLLEAETETCPQSDSTQGAKQVQRERLGVPLVNQEKHVKCVWIERFSPVKRELISTWVSTKKKGGGMEKAHILIN